MTYKRVLLAIADGELIEVIANWLYELPGLGEYIVIDRARNEYEARSHLMTQEGNPYNLIVMQINLAANHKTLRNAKDQRGLELLKALQFETPTILIAPSLDPHLFYAAHELHLCIPIAEDLALHDHLEKYARKYLFEDSDAVSQEGMRITFRLDADKSEYVIEGRGGFSFRDTHPIEIDTALMNELLQFSQTARTITAHPDWENHLRYIGNRLTQRLFVDTPNLQKSYWENARQKKIEICFDVARSIHPVILEALIEPRSFITHSKDSGNFWMLEAPIYRRLRNETPTERYPLFQGPRDRQSPINCLIIESPVGGLAPEVTNSSGKPVSLDELPSASREANSLETYLRDNKNKFCLGEILRIHPADLHGESFRQTVHKELTREHFSWHLVHYAGHCYYDESSKKGYVFFPGEAFVEAVDLTTFSAWLSRTQFVYLSACRSSEEQVVFELANNNVPAAVGFRWELEDDAAAAYTSLFYQQLFEVRRSLEYAFLDARHRMSTNEKYAKKRIWAAPMLIMQLNGSEYDIPGRKSTRGVNA